MSSQLKSEAYRSIAGTALTGSLADVGAVTANPARTVIVFNGCDDEVILSWDDGATEGFLLPTLAAFAIDAATNKNEDRVTPFLPAGAQFQAKHNGSGPTTGNLTISVIT